jgi:hypothetical protein
MTAKKLLDLLARHSRYNREALEAIFDLEAMAKELSRKEGK